ncbi:MAG TPA: cupin domain-containing protein [Terrimesophilobacter sp.]|uniref:cupin domain-containing protein n=1 Tax=Terrimesophilobacter sp. TaxID=2906435 RepID=UPI002F939BB3
MTDENPTAPLTVIDDLLAIAPIPAEGLGHTTALKHPDVRLVVLSFNAGHVLREHSAPFPLLMQALDGELLVRAGGRETTLRPGGVIRLDAALRHEVEAVTDSRLMLALLTAG